MLQFDLTLVVIFISFVVFMLAMKAVFFDPVGRIKILREQKIRLDNISAQELQQELETLSQRIHHQMIESRLKAQQLLNDAQANARQQAATLVGQARTEATTAHAALQAQLLDERQSVLNQLHTRKPEMVDLLLARLDATVQPVGGVR
jgi:F0F1-type ATP synthase membrane subunit b/b'